MFCINKINNVLNKYNNIYYITIKMKIIGAASNTYIDFDVEKIEDTKDQTIVTRNNIVWKLARDYCLCYCKTFSLVPDSTECTKIFFIEEDSTLFVPLKIK